jgi:hypothetical protein
MNNKFPEPFRSDFIAALRSGNYKQGKACLYDRDYDMYCCLGVAERMCGTSLDKLNLTSMPSDLNPKDSKSPEFMRSTSSYVHSILIELADMNDRGSSFEEIANYIEKNY